MEHAKGLAVCDTDPLKLHFSWALWQVGEAPEAEWLAQLAFTREAIRNRRLGFADRYLFKRIDPLVAQHQRDRDAARPLPNFGLHLRLHNSLTRWYETIAKVMPERLSWELPQTLPPIETTANPHRYDLALFRHVHRYVAAGRAVEVPFVRGYFKPGTTVCLLDRTVAPDQ